MFRSFLSNERSYYISRPSESLTGRFRENHIDAMDFSKVTEMKAGILSEIDRLAQVAALKQNIKTYQKIT